MTSAVGHDGAGHDTGHDDEDGYRGPATLVLADERTVDVEVILRGHFEPLDGRYRWYGRVAAHAGLDEALGGRKGTAEIRTPRGSAVGELSDVDPWGRYRIVGSSTPPFTVELEETP